MEPPKIKPDEYLSTECMKQTREFRQITSPKMAKWVLAYLDGFLDTGRFDSTAATKAAYVCSTPASYRTLGVQVRSAAKVQAVVNLFMKAVQRDVVYDLAEIQTAIEAADPGSVAQHQLIGMKLRLKRRARMPEEDAEEPQSVSTAPVTTHLRVPAGCVPLADAEGVVRGYKTPEGEYVQLADVEVVR